MKDFETRSITLPSRDDWHHINSVISYQFKLDDKRKPEHRMEPEERQAFLNFISAYGNFCTGEPTR